MTKYKDFTIYFQKREPCSTGANKGDKLRQGDEKTPEGIYFFSKKIKNPPNPILYGSLAFPLNYPNPIDKLLHKNGSGIWLHGRGKKLIPFDTRGCVAISNHSLKELEKYITLNFTPILIGSKIEIIEPSKDQSKELTKIKKTIDAWLNAWMSKDDSFFEYYDKVAFSKTQNKKFEDFIQQKKFYFKRYKWIDIFIPNIYILIGPYYTVSYFYEMFRCPLFKSTGIKRLYLMKKGKEYKIVATEWIPGNINLDDEYIKYHNKKINLFLDEWKKAWEEKDIEKYISFYADDARQKTLSSKESIIKHKQKIWNNIKKISVQLQDVKIEVIPKGFEVRFLQRYSADTYKDIGIKTIILYPYKRSYKILKEVWHPL